MRKVFIYEDGSIAYADTMSNTDIDVMSISLTKKQVNPVETREVTEDEIKEFRNWDKLSKQKRDTILSAIMSRGKPTMKIRQTNGDRINRSEVS